MRTAVVLLNLPQGDRMRENKKRRVADTLSFVKQVLALQDPEIEYILVVRNWDEMVYLVHKIPALEGFYGGKLRFGTVTFFDEKECCALNMRVDVFVNGVCCDALLEWVATHLHEGGVVCSSGMPWGNVFGDTAAGIAFSALVERAFHWRTSANWLSGLLAPGGLLGGGSLFRQAPRPFARDAFPFDQPPHFFKAGQVRREPRSVAWYGGAQGSL